MLADLEQRALQSEDGEEWQEQTVTIMQNANMLSLLCLGKGFGFSSTVNERPRKNVKAGSDMTCSD